MSSFLMRRALTQVIRPATAPTRMALVGASRTATNATATAATMATTSLRRHASTLHSAALSELEEERQRTDKPQFPSPPAGWSVDHKTGQQVFTLTKTHDGNEKLTITANFPQKNAQGEEEAAQPASDAEMELVVQRGGAEALVMSLGVSENELVVDGLAHVPDYSKTSEQPALRAETLSKNYPGPIMSELSEDLVGSVIEFLGQRGVTDELALFVAAYGEAAEQAEYENWLTKVSEFSK